MKATRPSRLLALALCLLLLCGLVLVSCQNTPPEESNPQGTSETASENPGGTSEPDQASSKYQDANGLYSTANLQMPEYSFNETEFRVAVTSNETQTTYFSEEIGYDMYETTDTVLNEAVKTRNDLIEEKYGVTIKAEAVRDVTASVREDATSNLNQYDAAMPFMPGAAVLAQEGLLYDLTTFSQYLHFDAPWWDQSALSSLSIGGHVFFTTGDISIMQKITSNAITFNKTMYKNSCESTYGSLYQIVREHQWTLDKMYEMGKLVTFDSDGEPGMTSADTFGLSGSNGDARIFYLASGERLVTKDGNDLPVIYLGSNEASVTTAQKVLQTLEDTSWIMNCQDYTGQVPDIWVLSLEIFGVDRALFRTTAFSAIKKLRNYEADFGIIPMPLINEGQETYYAPAACDYAYGICIPISAHDPDFSAYMIEEMCCSAKNLITPAYYEVTLKHRDSKDAESEEMLDHYIFNNVVYDPAVVYTFGGMNKMLNDMLAAKSADVVSTLDGIRSSVQTAIDECVEAYELNS